MKYCRVKKADTLQELQAFIEGNPQVDVPLHYLQTNSVYVLTLDGEVIGGFVYGTGPNYRYVERMGEPELRRHYQDIFSRLNLAELTILWLRRDYRKTLYSLILWWHVALKCFFGPADYIVFGTSVPVLTQALDYPSNTVKIVTYDLKREYQEKYKLGALSLFVVERGRTLVSMIQGVFFLVFRPQWRLKKTGRLHALIAEQTSAADTKPYPQFSPPRIQFGR